MVVTVTGGVGEDEVTSKGEEDEGKRVLVEVMNTVVWAGVALFATVVAMVVIAMVSVLKPMKAPGVVSGIGPTLSLQYAL